MSDETTDRIRETLATPAAGEDVRERVGAVLHRWNRLAGDVEGSEGPLTETEIAAISRDVAAALRSEAPGEVWREVDDLLARLERFEYDAAGESEEYWRVVTIRDRIAAARRGGGGGE